MKKQPLKNHIKGNIGQNPTTFFLSFHLTQINKV